MSAEATEAIERRQGVIVIVSRSTNGRLVDGTHLEFGQETPLRDGALIEMGCFAIRATHRRTRGTATSSQ